MKIVKVMHQGVEMFHQVADTKAPAPKNKASKPEDKSVTLPPAENTKTETLDK
ncbi:hypothetical protein [Glutamicibacter sp. NPDC087583]|uniref:hypothetical protein n=1 Tax=Glutamicibacter sp. NPDC087583 TaxID=3363995 RepID=UPI0037FE20F2